MYLMRTAGLAAVPVVLLARLHTLLRLLSAGCFSVATLSCLLSCFIVTTEPDWSAWLSCQPADTELGNYVIPANTNNPNLTSATTNFY